MAEISQNVESMGDKRKMITVVVGKEIEKIKGDFESYLNGLNMVGEISYSQYSELYDEGTKQIQKAYELGKSELEKENAELKLKLEALEGQTPWKDIKDKSELIGQLTKAKDLLLRFVELKNKPCASGHSINMLLYENICAETEQFLNSENIILEDAKVGNSPFDADEVFNKEMKAYPEQFLKGE